MNISWQKTNWENVIVYAFRYALGRKTYASLEMSGLILSEWANFSKFTKSKIVHEIEEYRLANGLAGMEVDDREWQKIIDRYNSEP